jgi:hypothetical protein
MEWKGASKVAKVTQSNQKQASLCWVFPLVLVLGSLSKSKAGSPKYLSSAIRELLACRKNDSSFSLECFICVSHLDQAWGALRFQTTGLAGKAYPTENNRINALVSLLLKMHIHLCRKSKF